MRSLAFLSINLKRIRESNGISQEELSIACGLNRTYISLIENKKRNISLNTLDAIAQALSVDPDWLIADPRKELKNGQ